MKWPLKRGIPPIWPCAQLIALRAQAALLLPLYSLPEALRRISPQAPPAGPVISLENLEHAIEWTEQALARLPLHPNTCLYRALSRYALLRRTGYPAAFRMGVYRHTAQPAHSIEGHAWVELFGRPFRETLDPALVVTYAYPHR